MKFYIESKHCAGDELFKKADFSADLDKPVIAIDVECRIRSTNSYYIEYLVEYEDKTRGWVAEEKLYKK